MCKINSFNRLNEELATLKKQNLFRSRRTRFSPQGVDINIDGKIAINFCSNDYLGLSNHPEIIKSFKQATEDYGVGSGSAHLICGHSRSHQALEEELAEFTGRDRALLFSTGYMANIGVIIALLNKGDQIFEDHLNHASLLDGGLLSKAKFKRYRHNDLNDLRMKIKQTENKTLIVTEGVFSMDGDYSPLVEMAALAKAKNAWLMVDDAHGLGVLGETGGGVLEQLSLTQAQVPILVGTLGKSFGTFGAFVAGSNTLIEILIQKARSYVFTTALPAAVAEATRTSLKIVVADNWRRKKLKQLVKYFRSGAEQLNIPLMQSTSAIQPVLIKDSQRAMELSQHLLDQGLLVSAIRPPTVPQGEARLRITFSANHQIRQVDQLLDALSMVAYA